MYSFSALHENLPNDLCISCRRSRWRPHKRLFRSVHLGRCARAELGTFPARRLHAPVSRLLTKYLFDRAGPS